MQGLIATRVFKVGNEQAAVVVEVNSETDFVARNVKFQELVKLVTRAVSTAPSGALSSEAIRALVDPETKSNVGNMHIRI
jgi:elongation factor Ts